MAKENWLRSLSAELANEGGYSADPRDPGTWTGGKRGAGVLKVTYYPIGRSGVAQYRRATTLEGLTGGFTNIAGSIGAGQISDRKHHYCSISAARIPFAVEEGYYYQFSLGLSSHTDAGTMSGVDGAAELDPTGGVNSIQVEYEPGATIEA